MQCSFFHRAARTAAMAVAVLVGVGASPRVAHATWSVIAVDLATGRIVIASATCVNQNDMFLMGVQAVVVPGVGVAACQAGVDGTHANQMLVFHELRKGTDPKDRKSTRLNSSHSSVSRMPSSA